MPARDVLRLLKICRTIVASLCVAVAPGCATSDDPSPPPPPPVTFEAWPDSGAVPLEVSFSTSSGGESWLWDFGDGNFSDSRSPVHVYKSPGTWPVQLIVDYGSSLDSLVEPAAVVTWDEPVANFSASPRAGERPLVVSFIDRSVGTLNGWTWDFGDGSPPVVQQNPTHRYEGAGSYTVSLTVEGLGGSHVERKSNYVRVEKQTRRANDVGPSSSQTFGPYFFVRDTDFGDCDFAGHGPRYWFWTELRIAGGGKTVELIITARIQEDGPDWSTGNRVVTRTIYSADPGWRISEVLTPTDDYYFGRNTNNNVNRLRFSTDLSSFELLADTGGGDICGTNPDDDSNFTYSVKRVDVMLTEE